MVQKKKKKKKKKKVLFGLFFASLLGLTSLLALALTILFTAE